MTSKTPPQFHDAAKNKASIARDAKAAIEHANAARPAGAVARAKSESDAMHRMRAQKGLDK
jgi:hypothetical protein